MSSQIQDHATLSCGMPKFVARRIKLMRFNFSNKGSTKSCLIVTFSRPLKMRCIA
jgi:hypothetical protein